ncbi:hypothetical protein ACSSV4_003888 [Roseovarius sp. MBR-154]|jgi:hypothetical protein
MPLTLARVGDQFETAPWDATILTCKSWARNLLFAFECRPLEQVSPGRSDYGAVRHHSRRATEP